MTYRVLQWYTGDIARRQIRYIAQRDDLELVGAVAYHAEKAGLDVGEIAGAGALGVSITTDVEAALAVEADCVLFNSLFWDPELVARILRSGKNVLTLRGGWYPKYEAEFAMLHDAATEGNATLIGTGNMPGLVNDAIPLFAGGYTKDVTRITTWESVNLAAYSSEIITEQLGVGKPPEEMEDPQHAMVPALYEQFFRDSAHLVAEKFGQRLSDFRLTEWKLGLAPADLDLGPAYTVKKGTVAGFQLGFTGFIDDNPWYTHTTQHTWCYDIGEGWRSSRDDPEWVVVLEGNPTLRIQFETPGGEDRVVNVLELNAARMVNLIPAVCAAPSGCHTAFDQPMFCGTATARPSAIVR
jgi:4-hydroxy-tetrahydrodipicolinate reductase